jgi:excisionase family DNA binding protein
MTVRDIREEFGLGRTTIWRLVQDGRLTPLRLTGGRSVRYAREEVEGLFRPELKRASGE